MLGEVKTFDFVIGCYTQADGHVDNLEQDQCSNDGNHPRDGNADQLVPNLVPVAFDGAGWKRALPSWRL